MQAVWQHRHCMERTRQHRKGGGERMTRKKFIKTLMAHGISRNEANAWAIIARLEGKSYKTFINRKFQSKFLIDGITRVFEKLGTQAHIAAKAMHFAIMSMLDFTNFQDGENQ